MHSKTVDDVVGGNIICFS